MATKSKPKSKRQVDVGQVFLSKTELPTYGVFIGGIKKFLKELIHVGRFLHPGDKKKNAYDITHELLRHWEEQVRAMRQAGIRIPLVLQHDTSGNPENCRGQLEDAYVEGDRLMGIIEIVSDDPEQLAAVSDVSIYAPTKTVDGQGNVYKHPIEHVSLCTNPLVQGMQEFIPIAASLSGSNTGKTYKVPQYTETEVETMDLKEVAKILCMEEVTDENLVESITATIGRLKAETDEAKSGLEAVTAELKAKKEPDKPTPPDPETVELSRENREAKLLRLVEKGKITPAVRKQLDALFIGTETGLIALKASLARHETPLFREVVDAFEANDTVALGEQTKQQTMVLSNPTVENPARVDPDLEARKAAAYPGRDKK